MVDVCAGSLQDSQIEQSRGRPVGFNCVLTVYVSSGKLNFRFYGTSRLFPSGNWQELVMASDVESGKLQA
jgi:hypothetical protein